MRRTQSGFSMCLLSGLLLLCLACLEIPEMSALNDDVSNDFTILTTDLFYKGRSQEKHSSNDRNFSCFAAPRNEQDLF